ncbi:electron transfer flavoprotein subunit beta [candidate division TA06 bacterium DG_24]|uniref:Electron transfer flavoprotein subunit beta n=2 Tax=Bacteria division TA06 TaxID=1156500 RepID=A0A0S7WWC4_UNCT6|nr:MAG: electron transfer flavoprotein subunit beta [candidate division TA06 bacterium DG_24]
MKVIICLKQVPDSEASIVVRSDGQGIEEQGITFVVNPYDEYAVEEAIQIKEQHGGEVTVVTVGPPATEKALRTALAMGADSALRLWDETFVGSDSGASAAILARALQGMEFDLILCGKQAIDDDCAQVGTALAELLDLPQATVITELELDPGARKAKAHREVDEGTEVLEVSLPAVFTAQKGLNEPRYPSLRGMMAAKKVEIEVRDSASLGLAPDAVGAGGSKTRIVSLSPPPTRPPGQIIEGEVADAVKELVRILREEAKVL